MCVCVCVVVSPFQIPIVESELRAAAGEVEDSSTSEGVAFLLSTFMRSFV